MNNLNIKKSKNRELAHKLRAIGYKVIHFLRFGDDYVVQTSQEMEIIAKVTNSKHRFVIGIERYS